MTCFRATAASGVSGSLHIPANGQRAMILDELPGASALPAKFKGVIQLTTTGGLIGDWPARAHERTWRDGSIDDHAGFGLHSGGRTLRATLRLRRWIHHRIHP